MIKVSEYIAKTLKEEGVDHVFMISGGGAMHLNDSFANHIPYICNHHEQASAIAAEGYARLDQKLAAVNVTTGPGGINSLNGVFGAWTDSAPVIYISGQVKYETTLDSQGDKNLRQLGDQEVDIISMVRPITKYAVIIKDAKEIKKILKKAIYLAKVGRPGPVWIDVPMNVQGAMVNENEPVDFDLQKEIVDCKDGPRNECGVTIVDECGMTVVDKCGVTILKESHLKVSPRTRCGVHTNLETEISETLNLLKSAKRPVIIAGHGIRISGSIKIFHQIIQKLNIPILSTFNGFDLIETDHPLFIGRIGTVGQRAGNFALQNADLVLCLGTRNNIRQVSYNWENFAKRAKKIIVDIDKSELEKPTIKADLKIYADLKDFFDLLNKKISTENFLDKKDWLDWCQIRKEKYSPQKNPDYQKSSNLINPYYFILSLTSAMKENAIAVAANGTACVTLFQAGIVKKNQRIFWNSGNASMGYDLPAAIGACIASDKKDVICIAGDGSVMMNLQELQTIVHYNLPIKIFVLNNNGYSSIRQTQKNFFTGKLVASSIDSGVSVPNFMDVAIAFKIKAFRLDKQENLEEKITEILEIDGPLLCEIMLEEEYIFNPKLSSEKLPDGRMISKPLEDMFPFLPRDEFNQNMIKD